MISQQQPPSPSAGPTALGAYFQFLASAARRLRTAAVSARCAGAAGPGGGERHQKILGAKAKRSGEEGMPEALESGVLLSIGWMTGRTAG